MSKDINQTVVFKTTPHEVYEALMDSKKHAAFSSGAAKISRAIGGEMMAYDDYITGKNIELIPDKKIVQDWRAVDWPEGYFSRVTFELTPVPEGTRLDFTNTESRKGKKQASSRAGLTITGSR